MKKDAQADVGGRPGFSNLHRSSFIVHRFSGVAHRFSEYPASSTYPTPICDPVIATAPSQ